MVTRQDSFTSQDSRKGGDGVPAAFCGLSVLLGVCAGVRVAGIRQVGVVMVNMKQPGLVGQTA
jgi:hypothetical protein